MRKFKDGATITIEPWRSAAFPVIKDLVVNRSAYDQILQAGGFISVRTNSVPDANAIPIPKPDADESIGPPPLHRLRRLAATCKTARRCSSRSPSVVAGQAAAGPAWTAARRRQGRVGRPRVDERGSYGT